MRKLCIGLLLIFVGCTSKNTQPAELGSLDLIPQPQLMEIGEGGFLLNSEVGILAEEPLRNEAQLLQISIQSLTGMELELEQQKKQEQGTWITLKINPELSHPEAYRLRVNELGVEIEGATRQGLFHGIQTLLQMLPKTEGPVALLEVSIEDAPKFAHRGLLLDACRHFWPVPVVKKYIDLLAYYKMNVLHWHLTEDQGWRIEIKKYPKLTEVGAWREEKDGSKYGGFYSQEEIKEVVAYAKARHITIIPEIEMPGHSMAALAAYPELGCTEGPFNVTSEWGVFKEVYCAGDEHTFEFLEDVLTEVMALFPGQYIHVGGDESPKFRWENCDKCQHRITEEGLHDEHELQSYFIQRIEKFLQANGRKLIGWDEILEGGLSKKSIVQSWRGMKGGIEAAEHGNFAIMSPTSHCYLDYSLDAIDLEKIYHFNPIPKKLAPEIHSYILGGECNMWTEHVPTEENLDSKVLPRMIGLAEALWSHEKDFQRFSKRLKNHFPSLENRGFEYGFSKIPIGFKTAIQEQTLQVSVERADEALKVYYTSDGSEPTLESPIWMHDSNFVATKTLKMMAVLDGRTYPKTFELPIAVHAGLQQPYVVNLEFSPYYTAGGPEGLTDGVLGTVDFRDGHWQGYQDKDLEVVIDLGAPKWVEGFGVNFYQYINAWIFAPVAVEFLVSEDGKNFDSVVKMQPQKGMKEPGQFIEAFNYQIKGKQARYVKMVAETIGTCPDWHDAAGSSAWLFIDEIVIH